MRPQDPTLDGRSLTIHTLEHGGEESDTMPQAIEIIDAEGRSCLYVPLKVNGQLVRAARIPR